jgi:hypothetical protein
MGYIDLPKFCSQSWFAYERRSISLGLLWGKKFCFLFTTGNVQQFYNVLESVKRYLNSYRYPAFTADPDQFGLNLQYGLLEYSQLTFFFMNRWSCIVACSKT